MTHPLAGTATNRRTFLTLLGLGAAATAGGGALAGCSKQAGSAGTATEADAVQAVLPTFKATDMLAPDIRGVRPIPDGYLKYPANLISAVAEKPGRGGPAIKSMIPWWGPVPPGVGNNSFVDAVNAELGVVVDTSVQDGNNYADKISAVLGARDVADMISVPSWEIDKISRFSDAVRSLFEDLTDYLKGDAVNAYPMLAGLSTAAWQYSVWGGRLAAVPFPSSGPFAWALFHRKDLTDKAGIAAPKTIDELYTFAKSGTDAGKGVWALGTVFDMVQQFFGCPGTQNGWRPKSGGGLEHKYEIAEYRQALEFTTRLFKEGYVHPEVIASKTADQKQLFNGGKLLMYQDGLGAWKGAESEQAKVTPGFAMRPVPVFAAAGGAPVIWGGEKPVFFTFIKKGLGKDRTQEILRVLNYLAAPFGTKERELAEFGVEGKHFTRAADHSPVPTDLARKEMASQYQHIGGRPPVTIQTADVPGYVEAFLGYSNETVKYLEKDLFAGIKLELPANYSKVLVPTEDKIGDILRGRRPIGELDQIVKEFRSNGGDEGRAFLEKALTDNGR